VRKWLKQDNGRSRKLLTNGWQRDLPYLMSVSQPAKKISRPPVSTAHPLLPFFISNVFCELGASLLHSRPLLLHFGDTSFLSVAEEAAATLEVWAEEKRQKIDVEGDRNLFVSADRLILRQAIINLLDNTIKYSPAESFILLRVHRGDGNTAILDVIDQGPGIPAEHQPYVFGRFYRVDKARTREWGGAGLGLSITRWAVEVHGGEITLTSEEERRTTFRVSLPEAPH
jgi:signal transduction histidine kinase